MTIIHKSAKGKVVDMNRLASQNELMVAVSNVRINARGDELGPGGQIIRNQAAYESVNTGIPVEHARAPVPAAAAAAAPVVNSVPVMPEKLNALVQPVPEVSLEKSAEKSSKGK